MKHSELVSVIIRTCGRPDVLKTALESIRSQTYQRIETIVVEDGKAVSREMIEREFPDLHVRYMALGSRKGRSAAGNQGLAMAEGAFFNFLDDDDIFFPEHIETLVKKITEGPWVAAYSIARESQIQKTSDRPYQFKEKRNIVRYKQPYNKLLLFSFNYIPIQSILFKRELYDTLQGFDEKLDYLEDWDLWVRYSTRGEFVFVPKETSQYYVPYRSKRKMQRNRELDSALKNLEKKFQKYQLEMRVGDIHKEMDYVLNVYNKKGLLHYIRMVRNFILYGEI